ncbi:MAG: GvpL/GvpF family gas vesicle protein [Syntrophobacteria bacterium]
MPLSRKKTDGSGKYLYAVIAGSHEQPFGFSGIYGAAVYTVSSRQIVAVVSDIPDKKIRPERRHLALHQEVLKRLMEETTPLPMSFGIIAEGVKAVRSILSLYEEAFLETFQRVGGKVEMGLRVKWDVPHIFDYFVHTHPELRERRDRLFGSQCEPTQEDKIELGRMFHHILNQDREIYTEKVEGALNPYCSEIKRNKCRNESEVMNLACLVGRETQAEFEAGIFDAASLFDNSFAFDYNGPWAPHNFVDIDVKL